MQGSWCILQQLSKLTCLYKIKDLLRYNTFPVDVVPHAECCLKAIQFSGQTLVQRTDHFSEKMRSFSSSFTLKRYSF